MEILELKLTKANLFVEKLTKENELCNKKNKVLVNKNLKQDEAIKMLQKKLDDLWGRQ